MLRKQIALLALVTSMACHQDEGMSYAGRVESPGQLIGGPGALGALGDWVIGNDKIRIILQDKGWSRGFGIFGGGIIDADIVRPAVGGDGLNQVGMDNFGEFFPALFLQAFEVEDQKGFDATSGESVTRPALEIINDGSDGKAALIRARASGGDFISMVKSILGLAIPEDVLQFETDFILKPGSRHLEIVCRLTNASNRKIDLSGDAIAGLLGLDALQIPLGDVALFGSGNSVFVPGGVGRVNGASGARPVGYDLRYSVEASYDIQAEKGVALPALPGLVADFIATSGEHVSYGFAVGESERNMVWLNRAQYGLDEQTEITQHSHLIPFIFSSFTGAYYEVPPVQLGPEETHEFTKYFVVGDGDVSSIREEIFRIRGTSVHSVSGEVRDAMGAPVSDADIHIYDAAKTPYSQVRSDANGRFKTKLEAGEYYYIVSSKGRAPFPAKAERFSDETGFSAMADGGAYVRIVLPAAGFARAEIRDESGRPIPAKVTFVANYALSEECAACQRECEALCDPRNYLFEFALGENRFPTDLNWMKQQGGQYIQKIFYASGDGVGEGAIRPGTYDVYVSRGIEYDVDVKRGVVITPGDRAQIFATLRRVVDTTNYISADLHVHSVNSLDSSLGLDKRVISGASEGLEIAVATDHNYVTDYAPAISRNGLGDWMSSMVGVELSTLEMGHFNAFPLRYDVGASSHFPFVDHCYENNADKVNESAFDWVECSPAQLFDHLRLLHPDGRGYYETLVQVNHARDSILGYFDQYYLNPYTGEPEAPTEENYPFTEPPVGLRPTNSETGQFNSDKFSYEFDLLEVFNGKRLDMLHSFVVPQDAPAEFIDEIQDLCDSGHQNNGPGQILLEKGGHVSYPGLVNDWMNFLNLDIRYTATGNSDSHGLSGEIGYPRNYIFVPPFADGEPRDRYPGQVHELDIIDSLRLHQSLFTNGPFLTMSVVTDAPGGGESLVFNIGDTVYYGGSNVGRTVDVLFTLKYAPWIQVDKINVYANGEVIETIEIPARYRNLKGPREIPFKKTYVFERDTYLVAEAVGEESLFPIVTPNEDPPSNVAAALGGVTAGSGIADGFGEGDGVTGPGHLQVAKPYALTNPIWLDIDASGRFDPPGNEDGPGPAAEPTNCDEPAEGAEEESSESRKKSARSERPQDRARRMLDPNEGTERHRPRWDIRKFFQGHHGHSK